MAYESPGYAAVTAFQDLAQQQAQQKRQALLDTIAVRRQAQQDQFQQEEMRQGREKIDMDRKRYQDDLTEKEGADLEKVTLATKPINYIPSPDEVERADRLHVGAHLYPLDPKLGIRTYQGTLAAREKQKEDDAEKALAASIQANEDPKMGLAKFLQAGGKAASAHEIIQSLTPPAPKKPTPEEDFQKYLDLGVKKRLNPASLTPEEHAWTDTYKEGKTLGAQTTAVYAGQRQDSTQDFQNKEKALTAIQKHVSDYQTADAKASSILDAVNGIKQGNEVAGSVARLMGTMGVVGSEGFNRINTPEINMLSNAGSYLYRLNNGLSMAMKGQPSPEFLQDLTDLAKILRKSGYQKYQKNFTSTKKLYGVDVEDPVDAPSEQDLHTGPPATPEGKTAKDIIGARPKVKR